MRFPNSSAISMAPLLGSRFWISNCVAFFIPGSLGEDASQFDLARVGRLAVGCGFGYPRFLSSPPACRSRPFAHIESVSAYRSLMQGGAEAHLHRLQGHTARRKCGPTACYFARRPVSLRSFLFLRFEPILHRPGAADLFIDLDEGSLQLPIATKGLDLPFCLALFRRRGETLGDGLAIRLCRSTAAAGDDPDRPGRGNGNPDYRIDHRSR